MIEDAGPSFGVSPSGRHTIHRSLEAFTRWWTRRDREVQRQLDSLWQRLGDCYWQPYYTFLLASTVLLWVAGLLVASIWVVLPAGRFWSLAAFGSLCLLVACTWTVSAVRRGPARPILDWVEAGKSEARALAAWEAAVALPMRAVAGVAIWRFYVAAVIPLGVFVGVVLDRSFLVAFAAAFALSGALFTPLMLHYLACDWYVGPIKREAAARCSPTVDTLRPLRSMRWRVLVALTVINDGTAVFASMLSTTGHVSLSTILIGQTIGFAVAALIAFGLSILATETIVLPVEDLVEATDSVRRGDLSTRVPVLSADELGVLSSRFNAMTEELQGARERLVTAREEERRRVRRDLHDGLGPSLAALVVRLELVDQLLESDAPSARRVIGELKSQAQAAIGDIRRLVYDLRPPSLDQLGLIGAIREDAARLTGAGGGVALTLTAPEALPQLPAAVEVAAFRIAQEALTNLIRHSEATTCTIEISANGGLEMLISDNGCGIRRSSAPGVGLTSMRERASELGGSCTVLPRDGGGTCVRACLPLPGDGDG